jgi:glycerol uptake facilitator-like aquaporin
LKQQLQEQDENDKKNVDDELSFINGTTNNDDENGDEGFYASTTISTISLKTQLCSEIIGTYILVLIGCGAACVSLYGEKIHNPAESSWSIPIMWTIGSMLGIYSAASISGGHLNPAVTLAFALVRPAAFPLSKVVPYIIAQIIGSTLAALTNIVLFYQAMYDYEEQYMSKIPTKCKLSFDDKQCYVFGTKSHIKDCQQYDELQLQSMSVFAGYYNSLPSQHLSSSSEVHAMFIEGFGTAFIVFIIFSVTSQYYPIPGPAVPPVVALAVGSMMFLLNPLTGDHLNPANEIGRRIAAMVWIVWSRYPQNEMIKPLIGMIWRDCRAYILGPMIGGPLGALFAEMIQPVY